MGGQALNFNDCNDYLRCKFAKTSTQLLSKLDTKFDCPICINMKIKNYGRVEGTKK